MSRTLSDVPTPSAAHSRTFSLAARPTYQAYVLLHAAYFALPVIAGLDKFFPVDGAFYLYADISGFSHDSLDFAKRMLNEAGVAATPGIDFDPLNGKRFLRFCYAGSAAGMHEAVGRITSWLRR